MKRFQKSEYFGYWARCLDTNAHISSLTLPEMDVLGKLVDRALDDAPGQFRCA
jgi:hypothetical protein